MTDLFGDTRHDAGGKRRIRWPAGSVIDATFGGPGDCYRYALTEIWDPTLPICGWLLTNPSVAGIEFSDPTLGKTGRLSRRWGYGGQWISNVHAYRATDPTRLAEAADPVGPDNDIAIWLMANRSEIVVVAHGKPPKRFQARGPEVVRRLVSEGFGPKLRVLRQSADGSPWHPRFLPETITPMEYAHA